VHCDIYKCDFCRKYPQLRPAAVTAFLHCPWAFDDSYRSEFGEEALIFLRHNSFPRIDLGCVLRMTLFCTARGLPLGRFGASMVSTHIDMRSMSVRFNFTNFHFFISSSDYCSCIADSDSPTRGEDAINVRMWGTASIREWTLLIWSAWSRSNQGFFKWLKWIEWMSRY